MLDFRKEPLALIRVDQRREFLNAIFVVAFALLINFQCFISVQKQVTCASGAPLSNREFDFHQHLFFACFAANLFGSLGETAYCGVRHGGNDYQDDQ